MSEAVQVNLSQMQLSAEQAVQLLKKLANSDRLMLLCQLAHREMNVSELEDALQIFQPTLSQQLGVLRREGLIEPRREGKQIYYRMGNPQVLAVIQVLYTLFCQQDIQSGQGD